MAFESKNTSRVLQNIILHGKGWLVCFSVCCFFFFSQAIYPVVFRNVKDPSQCVYMLGMISCHVAVCIMKA